MIITKEEKKSRNVAAALRVASRARRVKRDSFNGKRESAGTRNTWRILSIRNSTRDGGKIKKKKKTNNFQFRFVYYSRFVLHSRGGRTSTSVFFLLVTYSTGKIGGRGERRGLWVFWESAGRRTA